jgi:hypothetical protein
MAFLDNSGDIILDAVLTDTGRFRLAKGDGTFNIVKFALGDDEIDYGLYDKNASGGQAYYALTILQTPVLEAFSNNAASLKYRLLTLSSNSLLYLPIIKLYDTGNSARFGSGTTAKYVVAVDKTTVDEIVGTDQVLNAGVLNGFQPGQSDNLLIMDQGLDTDAISQDVPLASDLTETQYVIEMDNRLGSVVTPVGQKASSATVSFVDDDNIASYIMTLNTDSSYVTQLDTIIDASSGLTKLNGPVGTRLSLRLGASTSLRTSNYLFTVLGNTGTETIGNMSSAAYKYIDSTLSVTGQTTGYRIDIPVRYVKKI